MLTGEIYKVAEVADALKITKQSVFKLIKTGDLLALDVRKRGSRKATYRITRESFDLFLSQAASPRASW